MNKKENEIVDKWLLQFVIKALFIVFGACFVIFSMFGVFAGLVQLSNTLYHKQQTEIEKKTNNIIYETWKEVREKQKNE